MGRGLRSRARDDGRSGRDDEARPVRSFPRRLRRPQEADKQSRACSDTLSAPFSTSLASELPDEAASATRVRPAGSTGSKQSRATCPSPGTFLLHGASADLRESLSALPCYSRRAFYFCSFLGPSIKLARPPKSLASIVPDVLDVWSSLADDIWTLHKLGFVGRRIADPAAEWSKCASPLRLQRQARRLRLTFLTIARFNPLLPLRPKPRSLGDQSPVGSGSMLLSLAFHAFPSRPRPSHTKSMRSKPRQ